jgi:4'-phosphopantetheinyl transferase
MRNDDRRTNWATPPDGPELRSHQVHIWRLLLNLASDSVQSLELSLSKDEAERAARFHFAADKRRFIVAHAGLRSILARYVPCEPAQLSFSIGKQGKPALSAGKGVDFSLAHSGEYALVAVARRRRVGIDVERYRHGEELEGIARRYFSPHEASEFIALPPEQRTIAFFLCWTRKEAFIKAQGLGLSLPLDSFDVSLAPGEPAILRATRPQSSGANSWVLYSLQVDSEYAAAVAIERADVADPADPSLELSYWNWAPVP